MSENDPPPPSPPPEMAAENDEQPEEPKTSGRPKVQVSHTNSLPHNSSIEPPKGVHKQASLRHKRQNEGTSGWSFGNMAKAVGTGVTAFGSGVVQSTKAVGTGVVQGTKVVGTGVVQGTKAVGTGVVQGSMAVGTGVVQGTKAAGRATVAAGKGVVATGEMIGSAAASGVSAVGEVTISAGKAVGNASVSAVNDTSKWVKEQSESFGTEFGTSHTMLPGQTIAEVAETNDVKVTDLIKVNRLTSRKQVYAGKELIIPCSDFFPVSPHPMENIQLEAYRIVSDDPEGTIVRQFGRLAVSLRDVSFTPSNIEEDPGVSIPSAQITSVSIIEGKCDVTSKDSKDCVPDLLPPGSMVNYDSINNDFGESQQRIATHDKAVRDCVVVELDVNNAKSIRDPDEAMLITITVHFCDDEDLQVEVEEGEVNGLVSYLELWFSEFLDVDSSLMEHLNDRIQKEDLLNEHGIDVLGPEVLDESNILDDQIQQELYRKMPPKIQNQKWSLAYSTSVSGFSLANMYRMLAEEMDPFLIVIHDTQGGMFGAYLTCTPQISETFIGTGKSWLFAVQDSDESCGQKRGLRTFHWSGKNDHFFHGTADSMIFGASHGQFGILVDGDLHKGRIQECSTFDNWPLREEDFAIQCLECWKFVP